MLNSPDNDSRQIQNIPQNTMIYQRELGESIELHVSLTREERVSQLKSSWQDEIDSKKIDVQLLIKREKAKALNYPFSSETEPTTADVLSALNSLAKENDYIEIPYTEVMGLLGVSNALDLSKVFSTFSEQISAHRPLLPPDPDVDPSLAWYYWQVDQVGENLLIADEFFRMLQLVAPALYNSDDETVIESDGSTFRVETLVDNPNRIIESAKDLLRRYPADPEIVRRIVERDIRFHKNHFSGNSARIHAEIEDKLTYLYQRPLLPEPQSGEFGDETVASKIEAINQLRKYSGSNVPAFTLEEKLYWLGRSAFHKADRWSPHPRLLLGKLRYRKLESDELLDFLELHDDEFYERLKQAGNFFDGVKNLHAWNFLSERDLLVARNSE